MFIRYSNQARADLHEILTYISADNSFAAAKWLSDLKSKIALLADFPEIGRQANGSRKGLRIFPIKNYIVLYRYQKPNIKIVRVVHGAREWERRF